MCNVQELRLQYNNIGNAGLTAFAEAVESGALPQLEDLRLHYNQIGDVGMQALAGAVSKGALASLKTLSLYGNQIGDTGLSALAKAITPGPSGKGALPQLETLYIFQDAPALKAACGARGITFY